MNKINSLLVAACTLLLACNGGEKKATEENDTQTDQSVTKENKYPDALYTFKKDGLYGYMNYLGETIIEPKFKFALCFSEDGLARINEYNRLGNQFGFINRKGEVVITPQFPNASGFTGGLAVVSLSGEAGYINTSGKMEIEYQYATAGIFNDGIAKVSLVKQIDGYNTKVFGYIDRTGKEVIPIENKTLGDLRDGFILYKKPSNNPFNNIWGYFDSKGKPALNGTYFRAGEFYGGLAHTQIKKGEKWVNGFINTRGEVAFELPDSLVSAGEGLTRFNEGYAIVRSNNKFKYGVIDSLGRAIGPFIYDEPSSFSEGLALVNLEGQKGYIDHEGKMVIEAKFERAFPFKSGFARVIENGKYGFINKSGDYIHEPAFSDAHDFINGLALVRQEDGTTAYIDENGAIVLAPAGDAEHFQIGTRQ